MCVCTIRMGGQYVAVPRATLAGRNSDSSESVVSCRSTWHFQAGTLSDSTRLRNAWASADGKPTNHAAIAAAHDHVLLLFLHVVAALRRFKSAVASGAPSEAEGLAGGDGAEESNGGAPCEPNGGEHEPNGGEHEPNWEARSAALDACASELLSIVAALLRTHTSTVKSALPYQVVRDGSVAHKEGSSLLTTRK